MTQVLIYIVPFIFNIRTIGVSHPDSYLTPKMSNKPIFVATHPRACSTAFERVNACRVQLTTKANSHLQVFMTRRDTLKCVHEPFGDAFYYGPERLSMRYENDEKQRVESGFSNSTFQTILDRFERESAEVRIIPPPESPSLVWTPFTCFFLHCLAHERCLHNIHVCNVCSRIPTRITLDHLGLTESSPSPCSTFSYLFTTPVQVCHI